MVSGFRSAGLIAVVLSGLVSACQGFIESGDVPPDAGGDGGPAAADSSGADRNDAGANQPDAADSGGPADAGADGGCEHSCAPAGASRCAAGTDDVEQCADHDGDGCREWQAVYSCPPGQVCQGGNCVPSCTDQCQEDQRRCAGNSGYDLCHDSDGDGCRDWGMHVDCPAGMSCDPVQLGCVADEPPAGGDVEWLEFGPLNQLQDGGWGGVLTDIVNHCPPEWVQTYWDSDRVTHGHETTHGINSYLRNYENTTGERANGFYVLENRAAIIVEPGIRKHQAAEFVPGPLRGHRFDMYVTGQSAWDDTPLYIFDEWTAYTNGTAVAVDLYEAGAWHYGWRDACMGTIEFVVYSVALAMAVERYDPDYFSSYGQFSAFLGWQLQRALDLYRRCAAAEPFAWDEQDDYFGALRGAAGEPLRQFLVRAFGRQWTDELLAP